MSNALVPRGWLDREPDPRSFGEPEHAGGGENTSLLGLGLDLLALLRRNLLLVFVSTAIVLGIALFQLSQQVPSYQASAVVRVADRSPLSAQAAARAPMITQSTLLSQIQILQSRAVAREVVEQEGLRLKVDSQTSSTNWRSLDALRGSPGLAPGWLANVRVDSAATSRRISLSFSAKGAFTRSESRSGTIPYGQPYDEGGVHFTVMRDPGVARISLAVTSEDAAVNGVLSRLRARARDGTDILDVSYVDSDPIRAQAVVNTAVKLFQSLEARTAKQASVRRRQFIEQQLQKTETLLAEAQLAQNSFRSRAHIYNSQEQLKAQQTDLTALDVRRQELMTDRKQLVNLQQALAQRRGGSVGDRLSVLMSSPIVATNGTLGQFYTQLSQLHATRDSMTTGGFARSLQDPDVKRLDQAIASADTRLNGALGAQIAATDARLQALDEIKGTTTDKLATLPQTEAEEAGLLSQTETYRKEAERLRDQVQVAQIEEAAEAGQIEIVDLAALPGAPIGSGSTPRLMFAVLLGLALGMCVAYVIENHKAVIRVRSQLERAIPVANLALIPQIKSSRRTKRIGEGSAKSADQALVAGRFGKERNRGGLVTVNDIHSTSAEAFRTLRTNLLFSASLKSVRSVIVTSASPQEGKSTTTANLAVAFAQQGRRVLLVDCDLRRPSAHKLFGVGQTPGLTDVLIGAAVMETAVISTTIEGLSVLPAGTIPPNPAELLGGAAMLALLATLSANYDMVLIDTPPLLAASDAAILSKITDGVLVVVRAGMTERAALQEGIHQLENVGARVLGTVLNDPDAEVPKYATYYRYYYSNYYGYSASNG